MVTWTSALRGLAQNKEVRQLLAEVEKAGGWVGRRTAKLHILLRHEESGGTVTVAGTPSGGRSLDNSRAEIRRVQNRQERT